MNCRKVKSLISKYFDKQTDKQQNSIIFEHIGVCSKCKEEFELFEKVYNFLPKYDRDVELSGYFNNKLFTRINESKNNENLWHSVFNWRVVLPVLSIFVIMFSGIFIKPCKNKFKEYKTITYELYPEEEVDLAMLEIYSNFENL